MIKYICCKVCKGDWALKMDMPKNVDTAIGLLQSAGFEAYAVGGWRARYAARKNA